MKLGLLALLVVAALLPNLSDSRIVSKCELRDKLEEAINKTRAPGEITEEILAEIICEVNGKSNLNTSLVKTKSFRHKREASSRGRHNSEESDSYEENMIQQRNMEKHSEHESNEDSFEISEEVEEISNSTSVLGNRRKRGAHERRRNHSRGKGKGMSHESKRGHGSSESEDMSNEDSHETYETTKGPSNSTAAPGNNRQKRGAHDNRRGHSGEKRGKDKGKSHESKRGHGSSESENMSNEDSHETYETTKVPSNSTAAPGNRQKRGAHDNRRGHSGEKRGKDKGKSHESKRGHGSSESENMSNEDSHETYETTAASASYGIFQLSDGFFCDSGNNSSRNLCQKSCTDFTDDDITDDIECFLKALFGGYLRTSRSHQCDNQAETFLQGCS